jgi:hypothetical protein
MINEFAEIKEQNNKRPDEDTIISADDVFIWRKDKEEIQEVLQQ